MEVITYKDRKEIIIDPKGKMSIRESELHFGIDPRAETRYAIREKGMIWREE